MHNVARYHPFPQDGFGHVEYSVADIMLMKDGARRAKKHFRLPETALLVLVDGFRRFNLGCARPAPAAVQPFRERAGELLERTMRRGHDRPRDWMRTIARSGKDRFTGNPALRHDRDARDLVSGEPADDGMSRLVNRSFKQVRERHAAVLRDRREEGIGFICGKWDDSGRDGLAVPLRPTGMGNARRGAAMCRSSLFLS
jgi:hypothetical protein